MTKNQYKPDYPKTKADAVKMLQEMHDEIDEESDYGKGYRQALIIGRNMFQTLIANKKSTTECRKDCDVYADWEKATATNASLRVELDELITGIGKVNDEGVKLRRENKELQTELAKLKEENKHLKESLRE